MQPRKRTLAVKHRSSSWRITLILSMRPSPVQESDGISPTAIREIMLLKEIKHEHIVRLDSVHLNRQVIEGSPVLRSDAGLPRPDAIMPCAITCSPAARA